MALASVDGDAMAHVRTANKHGTAANLAEYASGLSANGTSEWERHAAAGNQSNIRHRQNQTAGMSRLEALIFQNCKELARLEDRIMSEHDVEVVARCVSNNRKKRKFIDSLRAEQRAGRK